MRPTFALGLLAALMGTAYGAPRIQRPAVTPRPVVRRVAPVYKTKGLLDAHQTDQFLGEVIARERNFYRPGVAYDGETGMSYDGHAIDPKTGALAGGPRAFSAASKESLHVIMLVKALEGDTTARALLAPNPQDPSSAVASAVDVLTRKITTYEKFDREHPGYGGFLPWYKIEGGKMSPTDDWTDRVPGLDNGQLAWSLYHAADALDRLGQPELAARYRTHVELMQKNVVRMFYDPAEKKMRAETKLVGGFGVAPAANTYANNVKGYFLDDPYEGLLLCHFADLFGDWKGHPEGKDDIWSTPRRIPRTFGKGDARTTVVQGHWFSAHEEWGFLVLPFRDVPVADQLYQNGQKVRTSWSAQHGWDGLYASTSGPTLAGTKDGGYLSALGVPSVSREKVSRKQVFAPYASFPLALADKPAFATWLKHMLDTPGMWGPNGMGESFTKGGKKIAPVLTWDGKALPMVALMGGIAPDIAAQLKRAGLYDRFLSRVKHDYSNFDAHPIEGAHLPIVAPTLRVN